MLQTIGRRGHSRGGLSTKVHFVVHGLGCPKRRAPTAEQKGDAPQAAHLIDGLAAEVVRTEIDYHSDRLCRAIDAKGTMAVISQTLSGP